MKKVMLKDLAKGETSLVAIRKVYKDANDSKAGFKPSIELAEFVENPDRPVTAVAEMNSDDERFNQAKPRRAFQPVSLATAIGAGWITKETFDKLSPSRGVAADEQVEGKHFVSVNLSNPEFNGKRLRVQILEGLDSARRKAQPKINPSTGKAVLVDGKPVFVVSQVAYEGNNTSVFVKATVKAVTTTTNAIASVENNLNG